MPTPPPGGNPNPPDKPGHWKYHEVQGPAEAKAWLEDKIARGYKCSISAYKYVDEDVLAENLQHG